MVIQATFQRRERLLLRGKSARVPQPQPQPGGGDQRDETHRRPAQRQQHDAAHRQNREKALQRGRQCPDDPGGAIGSLALGLVQRVVIGGAFVVGEIHLEGFFGHGFLHVLGDPLALHLADKRRHRPHRALRPDDPNQQPDQPPEGRPHFPDAVGRVGDHPVEGELRQIEAGGRQHAQQQRAKDVERRPARRRPQHQLDRRSQFAQQGAGPGQSPDHALARSRSRPAHTSSRREKSRGRRRRTQRTVRASVAQAAK